MREKNPTGTKPGGIKKRKWEIFWEMEFSIFFAIMIGAYSALGLFFGHEHLKYDRIEKRLKKEVFLSSAR